MAARRIIDGLPLYDPAATIVTPYAYLYPPPLAQALVPVALVVPSWLFSVLWTAGMGVALWWLAGRDIIRAFALIAFLPVAVEFWFRNVHLFLAVLVVIGLRGRPGGCRSVRRSRSPRALACSGSRSVAAGATWR